MKLALWFVRLYYRTGAMVRRKIDRDILSSDLCTGNYETLVSTTGQFIIDWRVYNHRTVVQRGKKTWTVLSEKALPDKFSVVKDGMTNKVA